MLHVGIDGRNFTLRKGTGVTSYSHALMQACHENRTVAEMVLDNPRGIAGPAGDALRLLRAALPYRTARRGAENTLLSADIYRVAQVHFNFYGRPLPLHCAAPPVIMHWTYPLPLYMPGARNVITIHDLIPLLHPTLTDIKPARFRQLLQCLTAKADCIVTVSETSRTQIISTLGIAPSRVVNLYQAVNLPGSLLKEAQAAPRICPPGSFVCVGTVEPRKNITRLLEAYLASGAAAPLAIIGPDGTDGSPGLFVAGSPSILRVPYAKRASVIRAIAEARALLFPSLAEGFGLPIIEAMTLGTPVMTSIGGATEEISGGAALLVNPLDVQDIAAGIRMLDKITDFTEYLRQAGLQRVAFFLPQAFARRLKEFYEALLF